MIPDFEPHQAPFIWAAYGLSALVLVGLIASVALRARAAKARFERLEKQKDQRG